MKHARFRLNLSIAFVLFLLWSPAQAAQLTLLWTDNNLTEDGTKIERASFSTGPFVQINQVGANITSYVDAGLSEATDYWYRVRAFTASVDSAYSNIATAITDATLSITKNGTGQGTVMSSPVAINCGANCAALFPGRSTVTLTAATGAGSIFAGWGGACSGSALTCSITMNGTKNVTATFSTLSSPAAPSNLVVAP